MDKALFSRLLKIGGFIAAFAILFAVDAWLYEKKNTHVVVESELEKEYLNENKSNVEVVGGDRESQGNVEVVEENLPTASQEQKPTVKEAAPAITAPAPVKAVPATQVVAPKQPIAQYQILSPEISRLMGFSFKYPTHIFKISSSKQNVLLASGYSFISNFSGLSNQKMSFNYSIEFVNYDGNLEQAVKKEMPYAVGVLFKDGKFVASQGYAENIIIASKNGFVVNEGAEGLNMQYYFLPKSTTKTLVIKLKYIGNILKPKLSETEQRKYFKEILESLIIK